MDNVIEVDLENEDDGLENMAQEDLIALIRRSKISGVTGSRPKSDDSKSSSDDSSSSSEGQEDGSSSASSTPSDGGAAEGQEAAGEG